MINWPYYYMARTQNKWFIGPISTW